MTFFSKNSRWRHKTLNICVRIHERYEGGYRVVWETPLEQHPLSDLLLKGLFTATDLVRDFVPVVPKPTRLDRLLDADFED